MLSATIVHGHEGNAAVITLQSTAAQTLRAVPIAITVKDAHGATLFQNDTAGLEPALTSLGSLAAHSRATWIDDQILVSGTPASVSATVGEAPSVSGALPRIEVQGVHASEEGGTQDAAGTVHNASNVTQQSLVVYVLARRAGQGGRGRPRGAPGSRRERVSAVSGLPSGRPQRSAAGSERSGDQTRMTARLAPSTGWLRSMSQASRGTAACSQKHKANVWHL